MSTVRTQTQRQSSPSNIGHDVAARVRELLSYVQQGRIVDAMYEFYAPDAVMQENNNPPTAGLEANVEREKKFVASVRQWKRFDVGAVAVDPERGTAFVQSEMEFEGVDGKNYRFDQVSVQTWRDGKIVNEKFYYDTGAAK
jgi:ketosteroid isomerase-like protein